MKLPFKNTYFVAIYFIVLSFLCYIGAITVGFLSDDYGFIYQFDQFGWQAFKHNFNDPFFIPVSHLIAGVIYYLVDGSAIGFHILQIGIHGLIAWQFYLLLVQLKSPQNLALLSALLFVVLPFQSESVVWLASKSYGYSLFFSILSIRYFFKWIEIKKSTYLLWHFFFFILAVLSKEMAIILPFVLSIIVQIFLKNITYLAYFKSQRIIYISILLTLVSFVLFWRFLTLDSLIGGYGDDVHLPNITLMAVHFCAWIFKYLTFFRYALESNWQLLMATVFSSTVLIGLIKGWQKKHFTTAHIIGIVGLLFFSLFPILSLEITSVKSIASERYGYFASLVVAFTIAFGLVQFQNQYRKVAVFIAFSISIVFIQLDVYKWKQSGEICNNYLNGILNEGIDKKNILLINIPDNYKGAYCLRNGLKEFLLLNNKETNFEVMFFQTYLDVSGGMTYEEHKLVEKSGALLYYSKYPHDRFHVDLWSDSLMNDFDNVFTYHNNSFSKIN